MKRVMGILMVVVGVSLVLLGLLFIVGASGQAYRYIAAVIMLALGGALAGLGVRFFKHADAASPEQLRAEILDLARRRNGEISESDVAATLGRRADGADAVLAQMVRDRICDRRQRDGATFYLFEELQPRLMVRRCEFCKTELPLQEALTECPNCGGTIKTQVESRSLSGKDAYSMDEE